MDTKQFLSAVLPASGLYCLAVPQQAGSKAYRHFRVPTIDRMAHLAEKFASEGHDVFFAVGTLKADHIIDAKGKKRVRTHENIAAVRSFILDLDVGAADPKKYPTQTEAITALFGVCKSLQLPIPLLTSSGNGVHAYWALTEALQPDTWTRIANAFKILVHKVGLKTDPSRTSDRSSVLRVVGTKNFKDPQNPKPVRAINEVTSPLEATVFAGVVINALRRLTDGSTLHPGAVGGDTPELPGNRAGAQPVLPAQDSAHRGLSGPAISRQAATSGAGLGSFDVPSQPADLGPIVERCAQIRQIAKTRGNVAEPLWYHGLQLLRHTAYMGTGGARICHVLSQGHPSYSASETDGKLAQLADTGPTTCEKFEGVNPGGCDGCAFKGKIKSPITIGRDLSPAQAPQITIEHGGGRTTEITLPPPAYPYLRTSTGKIAMEMADGEGNPLPPAIIYDYDIYPTRRLFDEGTQTEIFYFKSWLPKDGWREYPLPTYLLYDKRKLLEMVARQGVMPDLSKTDLLINYMLGYIQKLQRDMPADQIYAQLGWRANDAEIVIGETSYKQDGSVTAIRVNDAYRNIVTNFAQKGTFEAWRSVINIYNEPGFEDFALALMTGFGSLMFKFTGYSGAIFNLTGESGAGKSTVLRLIHSIYGKPTEKALLHQDTSKAKMAVLGVYNHLPITYDEITNIQPEELSDLCYAVSNGRGGNKLNQDSSFKQNTTNWQLPMFSSSNRSLVQILGSIKMDASGEAMRVVERHIRHNGRYTLTEAQALFAPLEDNYGHAGPILAAWLVRNQDAAKKLVRDYMQIISDATAATSSERFWVAIMACAMAGCTLGKALGLHNYDDKAMLRHCLIVVKGSRAETEEVRKSSGDVVVDFLNAYLDQMLVIKDTRNTVPLILLKPMRGIVARNDMHGNRLYVSKQAFRNFCVKNNFDMAQVQRQLTESGVLLNTSTRKVLGDGTEFATGPTACWVLDTKHVSLSGLPQLTLVQPATAAVATT